MKFISLTNSNLRAIVDDSDYDTLVQKKWSLNRRGYAQATTGKRMHVYLIEVPESLQVDHINRDKLDNRRSNLRLATPSQNQANRRTPKTNTSGYKGVRWDRGKWVARIGKDGKYLHIGRYDSVLDASRAYDQAAVKYFGDFAMVNGV